MKEPLILITASGFASASLATLAGFADHRRMRRSDPDAVGWVPWRGVSVAATVVALILLAFAGVLWLQA